MSRLKNPALRSLMAMAGLAVLAVPLAVSTAQGAEAVKAPEIKKTTTFTGEVQSAFGSSVQHGRCDINGDGNADVISGSIWWDQAPLNNNGAAYIMWGGKDLSGGKVDDPKSVGVTRIDGPKTGSDRLTGYAVDCLGDTNGDKIDDLVIADPFDGRAYVVFGSKDFDELSLDALGDRGWIIQGPTVLTSNAVVGVGDVNGDGLADIGVLEQMGSYDGRSQNGRIWIVAGQNDITHLVLADPSDPARIIKTIDGADSNNRPFTFDRAGDVDGDGKDDLVIGTYRGWPWGEADLNTAPGAAYVVSGAAPATVDLADKNSYLFQIRGPQRGRDRLGVRAAAAGDLNGDGLGDLVIGSDSVTDAKAPRNGGVAIVYGSKSRDVVLTDPDRAGGPTVFSCGDDLTCATGTPTRRGWWINGAAPGNVFGHDVDVVPDVTGDGLPELVVGAWGVEPTPELRNAGAAYLVPLREGVDLVNVGDADSGAVRILGDQFRLRLGMAVGSVGDVDGDGTPDVAVSGDALTGDARGQVRILSLKGNTATPTPTPTPTSPAPSPTATPTPTGAPSPTPTPEPVSAITKKWQSLGGEKGILGAPLGPELCTLKDNGCFRVFAGGSIYDSEHSDPQFVRGVIRDRWASMGWENSALGYPISDEICGLRDKGCVQRFQGGLMYWSPASGAAPVWGEIGKAYASMGWENSVLGYPTSPEFCGLRDNGCAQRFQHGIMYWSPATGAHPVFGAIGDRYAAMGWETSALGYPTSSERCGLKDGGCFQTFSGGSIYFSPKTGAWASWGLIRDHWGRNGWENGRYGYPSGPESCSPNRGVAECRQAYQGGTITWNAQRGVF